MFYLLNYKVLILIYIFKYDVDKQEKASRKTLSDYFLMNPLLSIFIVNILFLLIVSAIGFGIGIGVSIKCKQIYFIQ